MIHRVIAVFVCGLAVLAFPAAGESTPTLVDRSLPQVVGFNLSLPYLEDPAPALQQLDRLAELGVNAVQVIVPLYQAHAQSPVPAIEQRPRRGPTDETVLAVLTHARSLGLYTSLMPCIELTAPRGRETRRVIVPPDRPRWWTGYHNAVRYYAQLAEHGRVDVFVVGCELSSMLGQKDEPVWRRLVTDLRTTFPGRLTYVADGPRVPDVRFWDAVDLIGVAGFWDVTVEARRPDRPRDKDLDQAWKDLRKDLLKTAKRHGRPLLFAAVGYPSRPTGLQDPRNAAVFSTVEPAPSVQSTGYRAFLRGWGDLLPPPAGAGRPEPLAGVFFHAWSLNAPGGPFDTGYTPRGKPAEAVLRRYLAGEAE